MELDLPWYAEELFRPYRYKVLYGGRGSGKSQTVARRLLLRGLNEKRRVLCGREFQNSITESVHSLLVEIIEEYGLQHHYTITDRKIEGKNGTVFLFKGVRMNPHSIKSMQGITDLWLEEAHTISQKSWDILIPTIREVDSEIYVTFNPENEDDPTYTMFVNQDGSPRTDITNAYIEKVSWRDNPWFPDVLRDEKDHLFKVNPDLAMHVWEGECRTNTDAQIFNNKWEIRDFDIKPYFDGPYFGLDWGFSRDPLAVTESYIDPIANELLIRKEVYKIGVEIRHTKNHLEKFDDIKKYMIRADNARPESISHVRNDGYMIEGAQKWSGSVEDGIDWLKNFDKIVIHPDCPGMKTEARNYSFKVDRLTGDVTRVIVDAYNHGFDSLRYAYQPLIIASRKGSFAHV
tara:strand:- start:33978 stop:35186 length:1209 start_codon:yes stop_codon:yes gene_type:complete